MFSKGVLYTNNIRKNKYVSQNCVGALFMLLGI